MKVQYFFLFLLIVSQSQLNADTLSLPEITILGSSLPVYSFGRNVISMDTSFSKFRNQTAAEVLEMSGTGYLKSYGSGSSAIFSNQGTAPQHNQVIWNGIPVNNMLLGLSDISLLNLGDHISLSIIEGTSASYWGSGAIGSTMIMQTNMPQTSGIFFSSAFNTLNNQLYDIGFREIVKKWSLFGKLLLNQGHNRYNVSNYTSPTKDIFHYQSPYSNHQGEFSISRNFSPKESVEAHFLFSDFNRQLSSSLTESPGLTKQKDRLVRSVIRWKKNMDDFRFSGLLGYTFDRIHFQDESVNDTGLIHSMNFKIEGQKTFKNGQLYLSGQSRMEIADNSAFKSGVRRNISSALAGFSFIIRKNFLANLESRLEFVDGKNPVIIASGALEARVFNTQIKSYLSGSYNNPSLNDLFWVPGGNLDLTPEKGINGGLTISRSNKWGNVVLKTVAEGFFHNIRDWIQWIPSGAFWRPINYKNVFTSGLKIDQKIEYRNARNSLVLNLGLEYTSALNKDKNDINVYNRQLAYTPSLRSNISFNYSYKAVVTKVEMIAVGKRFTVFDESAELPAYRIFNLSAGTLVKVFKSEFLPFVQLNNLLDQYYETVAYRPREPRYFTAGFKFNIK